MSNRTNSLQNIRPILPSSLVTDEMGKDERFQNRSLRPIIKFQNVLLVAMFRTYILKHKNTFYELPLPKRYQYIENAVQKDIKFRNSLKGIIIGQFTVEEYEDYISNSSALNKRMMNMVVERLKDQVQLFEPAILV